MEKGKGVKRDIEKSTPDKQLLDSEILRNAPEPRI